VGVCNGHNRHVLVLRLIRLVPRSSVSLLLRFSAILSVRLVSRVTARSLHDNMLWVNFHLVNGHEISRLRHCAVDYGSLHSHNQL